MDESRQNPFFRIREAGQRSVIEFDSSIVEAADRTDELRAELNQFLFDNDCRVLIIDLLKTKYLPSAVLGVLTLVKRGGADLHLVNAPEEVVEIMQVTKLNTLIHVNEIQLPPAAEPSSVSTAENADGAKRAAVEGYFVPCPKCSCEQRISKHQLGHEVKCGDCHRDFHVTAEELQSAAYLFLDCPHCHRELRCARKYVSRPVACNFCDGVLEIHMYV
ncbi:MAG: STAS domain-containing protein [Planctomycetaceae bacterium]